MRNDTAIPRYNQPIRKMRARMPGGLWLGLLISLLRISFLLAPLLVSTSLFASNLGETARQLADRIASASGPGALTLDIVNHSSLDDKSVREVRSALQVELRVQGVSTAATDQSVGTVSVVLSESLREYVWTAEVTIGSDQPRVVLVSMVRPPSAAQFTSTLPITLKKTFLFLQEQPILDAAVIDTNGSAGVVGGTSAAPLGTISGSARLFVLDPTRVAAYRQQSGHWELEASLPITHSRIFPRDVRGRLLLRRDHLFDVYLPGTFCRSSSATPLTLNCSASDDPWPLTSEEGGANVVRAFYAPARNFFTGVLSPGIGRISNVPSFYSAAALPRSNYTLWMLAAVDGSVHMIDGITDQAIRGARSGSDLAVVHSSCGAATQLLVSDNGDPERDRVRAFEIPDRDPVAVSSPLEFDGPISALWSDASLTSAVAIVKREDTGWYEANRITVSCGN
jgi:hypothetical protein